MALRFPLALFLAFLAGQGAYAQEGEQEALEAKKEQLEEEIREINRLLLSERKQKGSVLDQMEALDQKISRQQQLIRITNQQSNLLNRRINANIRNISKLREDLEALKTDYAAMIQKSYRNRSKQNRLLFLLSSESWYQAFKRLMHVRYPSYQEVDGRIVPERLYIAAIEKEERVTIGITYRQVELNRELNFPYKIPKGFNQISAK